MGDSSQKRSGPFGRRTERPAETAQPFFLNEYKQAANLYPNRKVFNILGLLREYDMRSKGIGGGPQDDGELLRELLLKIFMT